MATSTAFIMAFFAFLWGFAWGGEDARKKITVDQIDLKLMDDSFRQTMRHRVEYWDRITEEVAKNNPLHPSKKDDSDA
jgi:hypothetical protein